MPHQKLNAARTWDTSEPGGDRASNTSVLDVFFGAISTLQASRMSVSSQRFRCPREVQVPVLPGSDPSPLDSACRGRKYHPFRLSMPSLQVPSIRFCIPWVQAPLYAWITSATLQIHDAVVAQVAIPAVQDGTVGFQDRLSRRAPR